MSAITPIYLRLAPADIAYVKFLIESYEGVAIVRTVDRHEATVVVLAVADFVGVARDILGEIQKVIACVEVEPPAVEPDDWLMREIDD